MGGWLSLLMLVAVRLGVLWCWHFSTGLVYLADSCYLVSLLFGLLLCLGDWQVSLRVVSWCLVRCRVACGLTVV